MSDIERRLHEQWLGLVQPAEGLVVSIPVLDDAQCAEKLSREAHEFLDDVVDEGGSLRVTDLAHLLSRCSSFLRAGSTRATHLQGAVALRPRGRPAPRPTRAWRAAEKPVERPSRCPIT